MVQPPFIVITKDLKPQISLAAISLASVSHLVNDRWGYVRLGALCIAPLSIRLALHCHGRPSKKEKSTSSLVYAKFRALDSILICFHWNILVFRCDNPIY